MKVAFQNRFVIVGFGSIGQGLLPLLFKHLSIRPDQVTIIAADHRGSAEAKAFGIDFRSAPLTCDDYKSILESLVMAGDFLVNVSVNVSSVALVEWCQERNALYLDTSIEPWAGGYSRKHSASERSMYALRESALSMRSRYPQGPTALLAHGANPGLVSHFVKEALTELAQARGQCMPASDSMEWAKLAQQLGITAIHISERDSQRTDKLKSPREFVNTWSITGFHVESLLPAELAWGTHEKQLPEDASQYDFGCKAGIYLNEPGISTQILSWVPSGNIRGFLISHVESISIADHLTVSKDGRIVYRPSCLYVYVPCDEAVLSLHELQNNNWRMQKDKRILQSEITEGVDELGVLLMGATEDVYWYGSRLSIDEARKAAPFNSATSLQVAAGVLGGIIWSLENPARGIVEPDDIDHARVLEIARPYLGQLCGVWGKWKHEESKDCATTQDVTPNSWQLFGNMRLQNSWERPTGGVWAIETKQGASNAGSETVYVNIKGETVSRDDAVSMIMACGLQWSGNKLQMTGTVLQTSEGKRILLLGAERSGKTSLAASASILLDWRIVTDGSVIISDSPHMVQPYIGPLSLDKDAISQIFSATMTIIQPMHGGMWFPGTALFTGISVPFHFHSAIFLILDDSDDAPKISSENPTTFLKRALPYSNALNFEYGATVLYNGLGDSKCVVVSGGQLHQRLNVLQELINEPATSV